MLKLVTTLVALTLATLVFGTKHDELLASGYEYVEDVGYYYFGTNKNWMSAQEHCMSSGARLAVINSEKERQVLVSFMNNNTKDDYVYAGFTNKWDSRYVSTEGIPLEDLGYEAWEEGKPSGAEERCGGFNLFTANLTDLPCDDNTKSYVCEHKLWANYALVEGLGYYKLHVVAQPWADAYITCIEEGGHLLVIDSQEEADAVKIIYDEHTTFINATESRFVFIGFRAVVNDLTSNYRNGTYLTVLGTSVSDGYAEWWGYQPTPLSQFFCGSLVRNEMNYYMKTCSFPYAFFCEKELEEFNKA